jgi:glycosyltransferase involved in cell wall biosynthesis
MVRKSQAKSHINASFFSLVVPVYNEEECLEYFLKEAKLALNFFKDWEIILVDDGSTDQSWPIISRHALKDKRVRGIRFTRNFGHQHAVLAGLRASKFSFIGIIDADLQDPPSLLPEMTNCISDGVEIVYGKRLSREGESYFKKFSAKLFYRLFQKLVPFPIPLDTGDFRVITRRASDSVTSLNEQEPFLRGLFALTGLKAVPFEYSRHQRFAGRSNYSLPKMFRFAINAIFAFSEVPYKLFMKLGLWTFFVALLFGVSAIIYAIVGESVSGWLSIFALVLFFGSLNAVFTALVGTYVIKNLNIVRSRPTYFISESRN